jgi:hypothetical protein
MGCLARWVCVGVVAAGCAETGDALFRKLPDAAVTGPVLGADGSVVIDAGPDAIDDDVDAGEADALEPDALDLDAML